MISKELAESVRDAIKKELSEEFDEDRLEVLVKERPGDTEFPFVVIIRMQIRDLPWMVGVLIDRICFDQTAKHEAVVVPYGISPFITKDGRFIFEVGIR